MNEKSYMQIVARHTKMCTSVFSSIPQWSEKNSTVDSYNLISNNFHANFKGEQLWNKTKFKLIRKRNNNFTNGQGGMIIQLRAAIFVDPTIVAAILER